MGFCEGNWGRDKTDLKNHVDGALRLSAPQAHQGLLFVSLARFQSNRHWGVRGTSESFSKVDVDSRHGGHWAEVPAFNPAAAHYGEGLGKGRCVRHPQLHRELPAVFHPLAVINQRLKGNAVGRRHRRRRRRLVCRERRRTKSRQARSQQESGYNRGSHALIVPESSRKRKENGAEIYSSTAGRKAPAACQVCTRRSSLVSASSASAVCGAAKK